MDIKDFKYKGHRNSYTGLNEIYFWTITINKRQHLLRGDDNKMIVMNSLQWLAQNKLVRIYGYVIMPNHIHLLWEQLKMNGKELPKSSFEKYTAKSLINKMKSENDPALKNYLVVATDRQYNIWLRDPLAIKIFNLQMLVQKLDYMHLNPLQSHWLLCNHPAEYRFSSAIFYEQQMDEFKILTNFSEVF